MRPASLPALAFSPPSGLSPPFSSTQPATAPSLSDSPPQVFSPEPLLPQGPSSLQLLNTPQQRWLSASVAAAAADGAVSAAVTAVVVAEAVAASVVATVEVVVAAVAEAVVASLTVVRPFLCLPDGPVDACRRASSRSPARFQPADQVTTSTSADRQLPSLCFSQAVAATVAVVLPVAEDVVVPVVEERPASEPRRVAPRSSLSPTGTTVSSSPRARSVAVSIHTLQPGAETDAFCPFTGAPPRHPQPRPRRLGLRREGLS